MIFHIKIRCQTKNTDPVIFYTEVYENIMIKILVSRKHYVQISV